MELDKKQCSPCSANTPLLKHKALEAYKQELKPGWQLIDNHHLFHEYRFVNFRTALDFANQVGALAEMERHHPDIELGWGYVRLILYTHAIDGLSENDFILAKKIEKLNGFEG